MLCSCHHTAMCYTAATLSQLAPPLWPKLGWAMKEEDGHSGFKHPASCVCRAQGCWCLSRRHTEHVGHDRPR